jgi:hypothetical protein
MFNNHSELNQKLNYNRIGHGNNVGISNKINRNDTSSFELHQNIKNDDDEYYCGGPSALGLKGSYQNTTLSVGYFSQKNMSLIQKKIKREVYRASRGEFKLTVDQDESDLIIVMRAIFLDNALHLPYGIDRQIEKLNQQTIEYIVPDMITNIEQQNSYLKDLEEPNKVMDLPINVNSGGRKTLPSYTSTWGF